MRNYLIALTAVAAVLTVTGCDTETAAHKPSASDHVTRKATPTKAPAEKASKPKAEPVAAPTPDADETADAVFLQVVRDETTSPMVTNASDKQVLNLGHSVCTAASAGVAWIELVATMTDNTGINAYDAGVILGSAFGALCPEDAPADMPNY
jgi:hypothetical protein